MSLSKHVEISRQISGQLDDYGYGTERVASRVKTWKKMSEAKTLAAQSLKHGKLERLHVGSLGEGIALAHESDMDILQANHAVVCLEDLRIENYDGRIIVQLDRRGAPSGYGFLCLTDKWNDHSDYMRQLEHSLDERGDRLYLSSKKYISLNEDIFCGGRGYACLTTIYHDSVGPSIPKTSESINEKFQRWWFGDRLNNDTDFVQSFPCECPDLLQAWGTRPRPPDWPSPAMVDHVLPLPAYVVPVGKNGSPQEDLLWRISFTPAEMYLVQSLNDTQRKVLIVLRHIAKHILRYSCHNITSYIVKNVVFWMAERTPLQQFQPDTLMDRLKDALSFLQDCIKQGSLPNYMIPERDLLRDKLEDDDQDSLLQTMSNITKQYEELTYNLLVPHNISRAELFNIKKDSNTSLGNTLDCYYHIDGKPHDKSQDLRNVKHTGRQLVVRKRVHLSEHLTFFNKADIVATDVTSPFSVEQLAEHIVAMVEGYTGAVQHQLHHHLTFTLPYLWRHKRRLLKRLFTRDTTDMSLSNEVVLVTSPRAGRAGLNILPFVFMMLLGILSAQLLSSLQASLVG